MTHQNNSGRGRATSPQMALGRCFIGIFCFVLAAGAWAGDNTSKIPGFGIAAPVLSASTVADTLKTRKKPLTFGIAPLHAAAREAEMWLPMLDALSATLGVEIRFRTDPDMRTFALKIEHGMYDIVFVNPQHYSNLLNAGTYVGLVTDVSRPLVGLIVAKRDSGIGALGQLAGREVCLAGKEFFGAAQLPLHALTTAGVKHSIRYVGSHESVYRLVAEGECVAGGGTSRTLSIAPTNQRHALAVVWQSPPYPNHVIAANARMALGVRTRLTAALLALDTKPEQRLMLNEAGLQGLAPVDDQRYVTVRPSTTPERGHAPTP